MTIEQFQYILHQWYIHNKRDLPWRNTRNPYKIWLSEIILQQTRVAQGTPYYLRFLEHFPDIQSLAAASEQEILRLWQGLGYYSRARNLHACAKEIVENLNGKFPENYKTLIKLKGIGSYTGAAIASFAFKEPIAVVDGNVFRVLSRIFGIENDISTPEGRKIFTEKANSLISNQHPDLHNQAIMEFGALQCTPAAPDCFNCAFTNSCFAFRNNLQKDLPVNGKKVKIKTRYFYYLVLEFEKHYIMKKRVGKDIWSGLYDFFLIEDKVLLQPDQLENELLMKLLRGNSQLLESTEIYHHKLTHQSLKIQFLHFKIFEKNLAEEILKLPNFDIYSKEEIFLLPKPIIINNYLIRKVKYVKLDL